MGHITTKTLQNRPFLHDNLSYRAVLVVFLCLFSTPGFALETATIAESTIELRLVFTDPSMTPLVDRYFQTNTCAVRYGMSGSIRENQFALNCKAEIVKFLLNSGYKRMDTNVYSK
jgi:hypothetical protein